MDNNNMKTIKFINEHKIKLNGVVYKPYKLADLPPKFGSIEHKEGFGIAEWFNYKGLTYVVDEKF
tara:strand:+ start:195 stop:389 length:195 start_codon:yes stop_codon:yes gene_type:complete